MSHRDIEDLLAERGIEVSYESIRLWRAVNQDGEVIAERVHFCRHASFS